MSKGKYVSAQLLSFPNPVGFLRISNKYDSNNVVRGNKPMKWKRRFKPESGILSDATGYMDGQLSMDKYPDKIRRIIYLDEEDRPKFTGHVLSNIITL